MRKLLVVSSILLAWGLKAQDSNEINNLQGNYLGLQVNELVRQIFSLGNTTPPTNPYFLNYSYNGFSGEGINVGFAYTADLINTNDNFNSLTTTINNLALRVGYEKKKELTKRFVCSVGIDFTVDSQKNETKNESSFNSQKVITTTKRGGWGLGPRFTFQYRITDNILIGTEANYYYKKLVDKFSVEFSDNSAANEEDESTVKQFTFAPPAILWLTVRW